MSKTKISEFDSNPANNTDIDGINLAEGMAPGLVNNAIRELMAQLKDFQSGTTTDYDPFILLAKQAVYPVGSVYINASSVTNPATLLGFGTWAEIGAGRVLVGQNTGDTSFDTMGETGGSKDAVVVAHDHSGLSGDNNADHTHSGTTGNENALHTHPFSGTTNADGIHAHGIAYSGTLSYAGGGGNPNTAFGGAVNQSTQNAGSHSHSFSGTTNTQSVNHQHPFTTGNQSVAHQHSIPSDGVSGTNANLQPYVVVKMWQRTA